MKIGMKRSIFRERLKMARFLKDKARKAMAP
jgi:hypothetical protein